MAHGDRRAGSTSLTFTINNSNTAKRQAVDAVRGVAGLGPGSYTDASPAGVVVKAAHVAELRTAIDQARSVLGLPAMSYTSIAPEGPVDALDFMQLRDAVR